MADSKNLWGGRFKDKADPGFTAFNNSFSFDRRLFEADIVGSLAYAKALAAAAVITPQEAAKLETSLQMILAKGKASETYFNGSAAEDVHSFVEARLVELTGDVGRKLHTGRSRNDQVATDFRLWLRQAIDDLIA